MPDFFLIKKDSITFCVGKLFFLSNVPMLNGFMTEQMKTHCSTKYKGV